MTGAGRNSRPCRAVGSVAPNLKDQNMEIGSKAPDFEVADHTGKTFRLSELDGKPVLVYVMRAFT